MDDIHTFPIRGVVNFYEPRQYIQKKFSRRCKIEGSFIRFAILTMS